MAFDLDKRGFKSNLPQLVAMSSEANYLILHL